jgi:hypothetical protein
MADEGTAHRILRIKRQLAESGDDCGEGGAAAEAALARFESRAGVRLPEEYRALMSAIQRLPSIVPFYGMVPPGFAAGTGIAPIELEKLAKPFPFVETWVWEDEPEAPPPAPGWPAEVPITAEMVEHGVLALGDDGCGMSPLLIVTGAKRGEVWARTDVGIAPDEVRWADRDPASVRLLDWLEYRIEGFRRRKDGPRNRPRWPQPWWSYIVE